MNDGEAILILTWKGRLRVLFTGKVKLGERTIRYMLSEIFRLREEDDE